MGVLLHISVLALAQKLRTNPHCVPHTSSSHVSNIVCTTSNISAASSSTHHSPLVMCHTKEEEAAEHACQGHIMDSDLTVQAGDGSQLQCQSIRVCAAHAWQKATFTINITNFWGQECWSEEVLKQVGPAAKCQKCAERLSEGQQRMAK